MAITDVDMTTAVFVGTGVILEHNDDIPVALWNQFTKNGASTYYLPSVAIAIGTPLTIVVDTDVWGCIPPCNPACQSAYNERFKVWYSWEAAKLTGASGTITVYGGTNRGSLGSIYGTVLTASGSSSGVLIAEEVSSHYSGGSALPYYLNVVFQVDELTIYKINRFDCYYRKWLQ